MQYLPTVFAAGHSSSWDFPSKYFAAWAFRDVAFGLALREVDKSLNALDSALTDEVQLARDNWHTLYRGSRELFDGLSNSSMHPLEESVGLIETWRLSSFRNLMHLVSAISTNHRASDAVREFLVAEEVLIRLESASRLPALYTLPESANATLEAIIQELEQQVLGNGEERAQGVPLVLFRRTLLAVAALDLGVLSIAFSGIVDILAPAFAHQPKLCACALAFVFLCDGRRKPFPFYKRARATRPRPAVLVYWLLWPFIIWASNIKH